MAGRGAPKGNRNAEKGRLWESAIRRALGRSTGSVDQTLDLIASRLVESAIEGDRDARQEIACRLDGKPTEHVRIDQDVNVNVGSSDSLTPAIDRALAVRSKATVQ